MKVHCSRCDEMHDISIMEPSHALPDCIVDLDPHERDRAGVLVSQDICAIRSVKRGFIRVMLPVPIEGHEPCNWGVWVEANSYDQFLSTVDVWTNDALLKRTLAVKLANDIIAYPQSLGLPGVVSFPSMKSVGHLELLHQAGSPEHELIRDQRLGVTVARKLEWLLPMFHANEPSS